MSFLPHQSLSIGFKRRWSAYTHTPDRRDLLNLISLLSGSGHIQIFGGTVRDFILNGGFTNFFSDIDITLVDYDKMALAKILRNFDFVQKNKFGGYRVILKKGHVDIWKSEETWAFTEGLVEYKGEDSILGTTFFNIDAIYFDIKEGQINYSNGFERDYINKSLSINLERNPNPLGCLRRAVKYGENFHFVWDYGLCKYALNLIDAFMTLYGESSQILPGRSSTSLRTKLITSLETGHPFYIGQQLALPF